MSMLAASSYDVKMNGWIRVVGLGVVFCAEVGTSSFAVAVRLR